jgi:hypothetical protein
LGAVDLPVLDARVGALPVHDHGRGGHQPSHPVAAGQDSLEQPGGPATVHVHGATDVDHRLAVADHAAEVEHLLDTLERPAYGVGVPEVAAHELRVGAERSARRAGGVRQGVEVVEHPHPEPVLEQRVDEV